MVFKGASGWSVGSLITGIIGLVILFNVASVALPEVNTAGDALNATGLPFATFFVANGIVMLAIMAALLLAVFGGIALTKGRR